MKYRDRLFTKSPNRDRRKKNVTKDRDRLFTKSSNRDRKKNRLRNTAIAFAQNYPKPRSPKKTL
jgi:hypothetical protein